MAKAKTRYVCTACGYEAARWLGKCPECDSWNTLEEAPEIPVAPARKDDPSRFFPWQRLAAQGFGLWCDTTPPPAPIGFDLAAALAALGYDPRTPEASLKAFRLHFVRADRPLSAEEENAVASCLLQKKLSPSQ